MMLRILFTCVVYCTAAHTNLLRIFGGRDALEGEFPYVVQIVTGKHFEFRCTASALTATWTLTAGHCVVESDWNFHIRKGRTMIAYQPSVKSEISYSKIVSTKIHPAYNGYSGGIQNDIALLHTEPVHLTKYGKLSPIHHSTLYGQEVTLVGYGMYNYTSLALFPIPQVLEVIARECQNAEVSSLRFAPRCSSPSHVDKVLCHGDSGGPACIILY